MSCEPVSRIAQRTSVRREPFACCLIPPIGTLVLWIPESLPSFQCIFSKGILRGIFADPPRVRGCRRDPLTLPTTMCRGIHSAKEDISFSLSFRDMSGPKPFTGLLVPPILMSAVRVSENLPCFGCIYTKGVLPSVFADPPCLTLPPTIRR